MCGIYGIVSLREGERVHPEHIKRMAAASIHRGPDDEGCLVEAAIVLGMRRLSIIDVAGGHQPISNEDETVWVVCNGEIYNFAALRDELIGKGHVFRSGSDCEVIVHLYEELGDGLVERLDGMFAFALWDTKRKRLFIARDRLGIKPLYYSIDGKRLIFASELKAILAVPGVDATLDPIALDQYLALGYVPSPYSICERVQKLPPACYLVCENGNISVHSYWSLSLETDYSLSEADWCELILERLENAVVSQMVSDVPLGAFLSGGIDSSSVVAFMARHSSSPVRTYSIGFSGGSADEYYNELPHARRVSQLFGTEHREILVKPNVIELLPKLLWHMDEPVADSAFITTYLVAEFARREVTVILSGVGGDELFGGYRRYLGEYYERYYRLVPTWLRTTLLQPVARRLPADRHSPWMNLSRHVRAFILSSDLSVEERYRSYVQVFDARVRRDLFEERPDGRFDALTNAFAGAGDGDALGKLFHVDLMTQLPDDLLLLTDRMTMATSLECRVPLLDHRLVELAARMPGSVKIRDGQLKHIFRKALRHVLPEEILNRKKRGFGAPVGAWMKNELAPLLKSMLSDENVSKRGLFRNEAVQEAIRQHAANQRDNTDQLLALMNLELWCGMYLDGQSPADVSSYMASELVR